jgi:cell division protein FtsW (lipid II flippase)
MLDEDNKVKFKTKFYYLAVELNAIILFIALSFMIFFIGPVEYRVPIIVILILIALVLSLNFKKRYTETKAWLEEHTERGKDT